MIATLLPILLSIIAPGLGGTAVGWIVAAFESPVAGEVLKLTKRAARGEHLDESEKQFIHEYHARRSAQDVMHGWR